MYTLCWPLSKLKQASMDHQLGSRKNNITVDDRCATRHLPLGSSLVLRRPNKFPQSEPRGLPAVLGCWGMVPNSWDWTDRHRPGGEQKDVNELMIIVYIYYIM